MTEQTSGPQDNALEMLLQWHDNQEGPPPEPGAGGGAARERYDFWHLIQGNENLQGLVARHLHQRPEEGGAPITDVRRAMARTTQGSAILGRMDRRIAAEAAAAARTGGGGPVTLTRVLCDAAAGATGLRAWTGLPWENGGSGSVVLRFERAEDETQAAADARRQATQSILKNALWAGGASQATVMGGSTPPRKGYPTPSGVRGASRGGGVILLDSAQMQALFSRRAQGALAAAAQDIRALWELPALKADLAFAAPGCRVEEIPVVRTSGPPAALGRQAAGL